MNKTDIEKVRIDIQSGGTSALYMLLDSSGKIARQGTGYLPAEPFSVTSDSDAAVFRRLLEVLDDKVFAHAGVYDHPNKQGLPLVTSVAFLDSAGESAVFEFRYGRDNQDVGELLPYFDNFIGYALGLTQEWYQAESARHSES